MSTRSLHRRLDTFEAEAKTHTGRGVEIIVDLLELGTDLHAACTPEGTREVEAAAGVRVFLPDTRTSR